MFTKKSRTANARMRRAARVIHCVMTLKTILSWGNIDPQICHSTRQLVIKNPNDPLIH